MHDIKGSVHAIPTSYDTCHFCVQPVLLVLSVTSETLETDHNLKGASASAICH